MKFARISNTALRLLADFLLKKHKYIDCNLLRYSTPEKKRKTVPFDVVTHALLRMSAVIIYAYFAFMDVFGLNGWNNL